jgi:hypothetical protein
VVSGDIGDHGRYLLELAQRDCMQFSIRFLLICTLIFAWIMRVCQPGGAYVVLPLGFASIVLMLGFIGVIDWFRRRSSNATRRPFLLIRALSLIIVAFVCFAVYSPFRHYATTMETVAVRESQLRNEITSSFHLEATREQGRNLLEKMTKNGLPRIDRGSPLIPQSLQRLEPLYIENREGHLHVQMLVACDKVLCLKIYPDGSPGMGTERLIRGLWLCDPNSNMAISDAAWDAGTRP